MASQVDDGSGTKRERVLARLAEKTPRQIAAIAEQVGARYGNFDLEEAALAVLEADDPPLTEITRRDVGALLRSAKPFWRAWHHRSAASHLANRRDGQLVYRPQSL